ncbi:MAG: cadmium-translocating P-type ATPase [Candidatus Obscuribacterales bacterium]|nr:cadmium-translocating P-type ATPase [Candidatus Obscuribacterales bacterium]
MSDQLTARFRVEGMDCAACGAKVEAAVRRIEGVQDVSISVTTGAMSIGHQPQTDLIAVADAVNRLGYKANPERADREEPHSHIKQESGPWWKSKRALLTGACGLALVGAYGIGKVFPAIESTAFLGALGIGLLPIARRAFNAARIGMPFSIEGLMTIAAVGAVVIGATEEAAMVVFLFLVGEMLEGVAASRARASIQGLSDLIPKTALLIENGQTKEVSASELKVGEKLLVRPGDRIAADGVIVEGESEVNEAPVTGESVPKRKRTDDAVFAGTINGEAALTINVTAAANDNTIARVIRLVEEAQESKAPTERFIDRFSKYYTPAVFAFAAAVAALPPLFGFGGWSEWIYKGLAVLLIGCPCALVISTPAAIASALSAGARRGLLLKGGAVLEQLGSLTAIAFDKTGTLTEGKPVVTDVVAGSIDERRVLSLAAALEVGSSHPLALAILSRAKTDNAPIPPASDAKAISGKGVSAKVGGETVFLGSPQSAAQYVELTDEQKSRIVSLNDEGKTVSVLVANGQVAGLIAMRDEPREDAKAGLQRLEGLGIRTLMLTGDNKRTAHAIGQTLGIEPRGELLPQDKMAIVAELQKSGEIVGKVGDGINDAPALAAADVGIAMGGGTDVALETADAAVLHGRVADVANMVDLSRRTMSNIRQNIAIALGLKAVFLATTVMGITGLWPAILADTGATVLVTANAMRLLQTPAPR